MYERSYRQAFAGIANHDDVPDAVQMRSVFRSHDGGETFGDPTFGLDEPPVFGVEVHDGRLLSYAFVPSARVDIDGQTHLTLGVRVSEDRGETWPRNAGFDAILTLPSMAPGLGRPRRRFSHRRRARPVTPSNVARSATLDFDAPHDRTRAHLVDDPRL